MKITAILRYKKEIVETKNYISRREVSGGVEGLGNASTYDTCFFFRRFICTKINIFSQLNGVVRCFTEYRYRFFIKV